MGPVAPVIGKALLSAVISQGVAKAFGGSGKKGSGIRPPAAPPGPPAPPPEKTSFNRPGPMEAPSFLQLSGGMTPVQKRSSLATFGVSGGSKYRDPAALKYYGNLAFNDLLDESGAPRTGATPLPVEVDFLKQAFGETPKTDDLQGFLNALDRGTSKLG